MSERYQPNEIEQKWQKRWEEENADRAEDFSKQPKAYVLFEFPYPSGDGLHVGHARPYSAMDAVARTMRLQGKNVLFPIGWDAFGLPTENYAIKNRIHPRTATDRNIATFRRQMKELGLSLDWSREVDTTDPAYYRWTQWIFLQFFKAGLAYQAEIAINWCPKDKIGLANEEVVAGKCERCGTEVTRKLQKQWMLRITAYAERLLQDLETIDYPERVKVQQKNWIGKSEGAIIRFPMNDSAEDSIDVFTTRIDTIFSGTFIILSPEHPFIERNKTKVNNFSEVQKYTESAKRISDIERTAEGRDWSGVELQGISVVNPATKEEIPVWVADFVLPHYGEGAVFADAHDERDFFFAKKYNIPLRVSIRPEDDALYERVKKLEVCYSGEGIVFHSQQFDGLHSAQARVAIREWLAQSGFASAKVTYRLRDWVFSRQHYWGEPIPIIHCPEHGAVAVPEDQLPVELPHVEKYEPTGTGESPLASITDWVETTCPRCKKPARRETDTMPNWAGSSWYYLRYTDPDNNRSFADAKKLAYWLPVDLYEGGMEHTTLHLLYSRFWHKFLYDQKLVPTSEPYTKRRSHGIVLAEDSRKMSKSFGNVINPDDIVHVYGADALRLYEMFMGPFEEAIPWSTKGLIGMYRFLERIWKFSFAIRAGGEHLESKPGASRSIHKTIKKVTDDIEGFHFNTALSSLMEFFNERDFGPKITEHGPEGAYIDHESFQKFLILLYPFAPHIASEVWEQLQYPGRIDHQPWPHADPAKLMEDEVTIVVQINGKLRARIIMPKGSSQDSVDATARADSNISAHLQGKSVHTVIYVPDRLINFVT